MTQKKLKLKKSRAKKNTKQAAKPTHKFVDKAEKLSILDIFQAERFLFTNGLRLIYVQRKIAPVFSYFTWYNVGSRDEDPNYSGLAHLFEHMMFKGTKQRKPGVFDRLMESNGARDLNAFTSTDYTGYVQSLPVEAFPLVAELESERMTSLILGKKSFESEREVVRNERKERTENNPDGKMYEELSKLAYHHHPYGWPVIGFAEDLDRMQTKDLLNFYRRFYAPNNAVIVVVGNLNRTEVLREIGKRYGSIPRAEIRRHIPKEEPAQNGERRIELRLNIQVEKAYIAYKIPPAEHKDQLILTVISTILTGGRSSRLYQAMVDKGIAMEIQAGSGQTKDPGLFYFVYSAQIGKSAEQCLEILDQELERLQRSNISERELKKVKNKIKMEFYQSLTTNSSIARFIGHSEIILGDFMHEVEQFRRLEQVTVDDVRIVAREYFLREKRSIVFGKPKRVEA